MPESHLAQLQFAMPRLTQPLIERRHDQMFPRLEPAEINRLRRFGVTRSYAPGEYLVTTGNSWHTRIETLKFPGCQ